MTTFAAQIGRQAFVQAADLVPEPEEVKALHRVLALTSALDETLYTSMGMAEPAYVLLTCAKSSAEVVLVPLLVPLLKSAESAERKSLENAPPEPFWLTMTRYCNM